MALEIQNNAAATNLTFTGRYRATESTPWILNRTWTRPIDAASVDTVQVSIGMMYDTSFIMTNNANSDTDQVYFSDAAWGYNNNGGSATVTTFTVTSEAPGKPASGFYPLERGARIAGTLSGNQWMSLFRYIVPGRKPADLSTGNYAYIEFEAQGNTPIELQLIKRSIDSWDQFRATVG